MRPAAILLLIFSMAIPVLLSAQLNHFIYLQTEGKQPFYAKIDKKVLSSSASGYLILSKLKDGDHTITIGFPKGESGEQTYTCNVASKDAGFLIKNFGEKGWGLFNLQTLDVVMANASKPDIAGTPAKEKPDEFSSMLSEVVNDPSIKQPEKQTASVKESVAVAKQENKPVVAVSEKTVIIKGNTITTPAGIETIYIDISNNKPDTVIVLIPVEQGEKNDTIVSGGAVKYAIEENSKTVTQPKPAIKEEARNNENELKQTEAVVEDKKNDKAPEVEADKKFLPIDMKPAARADSAAAIAVASPMINSDCKAIATEDDFFKLRKKMASADTEDEMITVAQKFFKAKCYATSQVKNLSFLFLNDAGKYRFFDIVYPFVSDSHNFSTLENQLTDSYYISRFKAMVRH